VKVKLRTGGQWLDAIQGAGPETAYQANTRMLERKLICPRGHQTVYEVQIAARVVRARLAGTDKILGGPTETHPVIEPVLMEAGWCSECNEIWTWDAGTAQARAWPAGRKLPENDDGYAICTDCGNVYEGTYKEVFFAEYENDSVPPDRYFSVATTDDVYVEDEYLSCKSCGTIWIVKTIPMKITGRT